MKPLAAAALMLSLSACVVVPERTTTTTTRVVASVTPAQTAACVSAVARARGVPEALVTNPTASASPTGAAIVTVNVNGIPATCTYDALGNVGTVTVG